MNTTPAPVVYLCWDSTEPAPAECLEAGLVPCKWVDIPRDALFVNFERYRDVSRWNHIERTRQWAACQKNKPSQGWCTWGYFKTPAAAKARAAEFAKVVA